jgi:hypothetical protein
MQAKKIHQDENMSQGCLLIFFRIRGGFLKVFRIKGGFL